ncbi:MULTISPECIES: glycosyltransferase family 2 protein [unclassified Bradyrhizobium]
MLLSVLNISLEIASGLLALLTAAFATQAIATFFLNARSFEISAHRPTVAVLVPAHNEERSIEATLSCLKQDLSPGDRLLVVADNCSDCTGELAAQSGAEVLIRSNAEQRGKGFALAAGLQLLARTPPQVVVFIDADCQISSNGIGLLAQACATAGAPIQCLDLMEGHPDSRPRPRLAEFAWRIKNDLRPDGYSRLGLPSQLHGTGMAVPWALINPALFETGHLAEDIFLGLELAIQGHPARFFREVRVTSYFPDARPGQAQQRQRWVHGHLGLIKSHLPRIVRHAMKTRDIRLLALSADLAVPPLGVLAMANIMLLTISLIDLAIAGLKAPLVCAIFAFALFSLPLAVAWHVVGRDLIGFKELAQAPLHAISVVRSAVTLACGRRAQWIRADRLWSTARVGRHTDRTSR